MGNSLKFTRIEITRLDIELSRWPNKLSGFTIVQLSDLHFMNPASEQLIRDSVDIANKQNPDIILLTGDYVTHSCEYAVPCARILAELRAPHGIYAVLGNHEIWTGAEFVNTQLLRAGITTLRDERIRLSVGGQDFWLIGIEDTGYSAYSVPAYNSFSVFTQKWQHKLRILTALLASIPDSDSKILMVHNPDFTEMIPDTRIDLVVCGHTHGGQIKLPIVGSPIVPSCFGQKYSHGLTRGNSGTATYVNRGIGLSPVWIRLNCPSEVAVLRLWPAKS